MSNVAGSVTILLSADQTSFSASLTEAQRNLDKLANKSKEASGHTVSGMQAASASIRLLENPLGNNTRAIERLISQSKILSTVMQAAFPIVGAIAIGMVVAKLGKEVAEFISKVNEMPAAITRGFGTLNLASQTANDQLELTNETLQNSINKLQGKPVNTLVTGFTEAKLAADKLAESISADNEKLDQLLSKNHLSGFALLLGKQGTAEREGTITYYGQQQNEAGLRYQQAVRGHDDAGAARALQDLHNSQNSELQNVLKDKASREKNQKDAGPDSKANIAIDTGVASAILEQQNRDEAILTNAKLTAQNKSLEAAKAAADGAKAAAAKALEARKKAAEEQLHAWENENSDWRAEEDRSLLQDASWWKAKLNTLTTGSLNYRTVNEKVNRDIIADNREFANKMREFTSEYLDGGNKRDWVSPSDTANIDAQGKATVEWIAALRQGVVLQQEMSDAQAGSSIQMSVAIGHVTRLDAAQQLSNLHTAQYQAQIEALRDSRQSVLDNSSLTDLERKAQLAQVANQIAGVEGRRTIQSAQDNEAANPSGTLASVGFVDSLNEFVLASRDAAGQMRELVTGTLSSLNAEILKGITGGKTDFKSVGSGLAKNIAGTALQKAEGSALSALGFGSSKADGTKGSPLYVRMADAVSGTVANAASGMFGKAGGFLSSILGALPAFANGGAVSPGTLALVGERGPELAYFGQGANVIPNHQLSTIGAGSGSDSRALQPTINVANGVTPEQMHMHVRTALQEYHEQVARPGVMPAVRDNTSRRPSSYR